MSTEENKLVQDAIKQAVEFSKLEIQRLKQVEETYRRLMTFISVFSEMDPHSQSIKVEITKAQQVMGKSWEDICLRARDSMTGANL